MAVQVGVGYIDIKPDMSGFSRDLRRDLSGDLGRAGNEAGTTLGGSLKGAFTAATAGLGIAAVGSFLKNAVAAATESNKIAAQTAAAIKSTGGVARVTADEIGNLADQISKKTGVDDEAIASAENLLLTFTNIRNEVGQDNDIFSQATQALVDMGAALGGDASSQAIQLGKALNDPIQGVTALTRVGVTFTDQQKEQIKVLVDSGRIIDAQKIILKELGTEFGGSAEAQATASDKLGVAFGNLQEQIGNELLPVVEDFAELLTTSVIPAITDLLSTGGDAESWASHLQDFFADVAGFIIGTLQEVFRVIANVADKLPFHWGEKFAKAAREAADSTDDFRDRLHATKAELQDAANGSSVFSKAQHIANGILKEAVPILDLHTEAVRDNDKAERDAAAARRDLNHAQREYDKLLAEGAVNEQAVADARESLADATRAAAHADRELADAQKRYDAALANANDLKGWDTAQEELADATLDLADAQDAAKDAHNDAAKAAAELRAAQAGDPEFQDKLAEAFDRVADAKDHIAEADETARAKTVALTTATDALTEATRKLNVQQAEQITNQDLLVAGLGMLGAGTPAVLGPQFQAPFDATQQYNPGTVVGVPAPSTVPTTINNVTLNITQTDPNPVDIIQKMTWALIP